MGAEIGFIMFVLAGITACITAAAGSGNPKKPPEASPTPGAVPVERIIRIDADEIVVDLKSNPWPAFITRNLSVRIPGFQAPTGNHPAEMWIKSHVIQNLTGIFGQAKKIELAILVDRGKSSVKFPSRPITWGEPGQPGPRRQSMSTSRKRDLMTTLPLSRKRRPENHESPAL